VFAVYIGVRGRATLVDLKVVTGMLQMHRLRRATEDSKQFHALPRCLASPRLPESARLPAQTTQQAPLYRMSLRNPIFTITMFAYGVRTCVSLLRIAWEASMKVRYDRFWPSQSARGRSGRALIAEDWRSSGCRKGTLLLPCAIAQLRLSHMENLINSRAEETPQAQRYGSSNMYTLANMRKSGF